MGKKINPAGESPPSRSERPIPDPLDKAPHNLTDSEIAEINGENDEPVRAPGRASGTSEDLETLFDNPNPDHLKDGFAGSGDEEGPDDRSLSQNDGDLADEET